MHWLVGVPVYNEAPYVERVLEGVRRYPGDLLVVDDGSTDETGEILARMDDVTVHTHEKNEGYGRSLVEIFEYAMNGGYNWVITLDADEQHEPATIADFQAVAAEERVDIISGSRYVVHSLHEGAAPNDRRWINCQITELLRDLTGYELTDAFCGFKAYRVEGLRKLSLSEPGYSLPLQVWIQAARAGLSVREVPIKLIYKDPNRRFGGALDDADRRLRYYLDTLGEEIGRHVEPICDGKRPGCRCR